MDIEALAKEVGEDAWDVWRDSQGRLHIGLDGISLLPELEKFAELVADRTKQECRDEINKWIKPGELQGNGWNDTAQRNGMILASNLIDGLMGANADVTGLAPREDDK